MASLHQICTVPIKSNSSRQPALSLSFWPSLDFFGRILCTQVYFVFVSMMKARMMTVRPRGRTIDDYVRCINTHIADRCDECYVTTPAMAFDGYDMIYRDEESVISSCDQTFSCSYRIMQDARIEKQTIIETPVQWLKSLVVDAVFSSRYYTVFLLSLSFSFSFSCFLP